MAGILDPKTRVMDFMLTHLGREQASQGELNVSYATLTDRAAFYSSGSNEGVADNAAERIYFESASSPYDMITVEVDFEGHIKPFRADEFSIRGGNVVTASAYVGNTATLDRGEIIEASSKILNSITASLDNTQYIRTSDLFTKDADFIAEPKNLYFSFNDDPDLPPTGKDVVHVDNMESLFQDEKLAHIPNFRFLPPRNKPGPENLDGAPLGNYLSFRDKTLDSNRFFRKEVRKMWNSVKKGYERRKVFFKMRTPDNNIVMQPFEFTHDGISKLSIIDGGSYKNSSRERRRIYYLGKLMADSKDTTAFVHIFTLVFREEF